MFRDADNIPLKVGDTIMAKSGDGCFYIIKEFIVHELVIEIVCENINTHEVEFLQLQDVIKI